MDVSVEKLPKSVVKITVTLSWDEWKEELDHAVLHLGKEIKMEGFRAGKVPRAVLEKRLGKNTILIEGAEHAVDHTYPKALADSKLDAIGKPEAQLGDIVDGSPLTYTVTTAVMPEVRLGKWEGAVKKLNADGEKTPVTVSEEEKDEALRKLIESRAKYTTVNREARDGDMVEVDFLVLRNNVPIENGSSRKHPVVLGKGAFIPGFEEQLLGMKAGEDKVFTLTFPKTYHAKDLAGQEAEFRVTVQTVQERDIPALDDAFAKSLGTFDSLAALTKSVVDGLLEEKKAKVTEDHRVKLLEAVIEHTEAELPDVLVARELDRMVAEFEHQAQMMGTTLDDFLAKAGKKQDDLRSEWQGQAEKRILSSLALEQLAIDRGVTVEQEAVEEEMNKALAYFKSIKQAEDKLDLPLLYSSTRSRLRNEKVFAVLEKLS